MRQSEPRRVTDPIYLVATSVACSVEFMLTVLRGWDHQREHVLFQSEICLENQLLCYLLVTPALAEQVTWIPL